MLCVVFLISSRESEENKMQLNKRKENNLLTRKEERNDVRIDDAK